METIGWDCRLVSWDLRNDGVELFWPLQHRSTKVWTPLILLLDYTKAIDCTDHNKLCKILKEMGIPNHLTCLLRNLYSGQKATVRTEHGTTDWLKIEKGCILSPYLFNLYIRYIMWNAGLDESQTGIKIAKRNISNLRYAVETTLTVESEEKLKSLLMKVKEKSEKSGFKTQCSKNIDYGIWSYHFMAKRWEKIEIVTDFIFLGSKITTDGDCSHEIKMLVPWKKIYDQPRQCIKKQRHHFANKGHYSQSYGFSSSHVWMRVGP